MDNPGHELRRLRQELEAVQAQTRRIAERLERLERLDRESSALRSSSALIPPPQGATPETPPARKAEPAATTTGKPRTAPPPLPKSAPPPPPPLSSAAPKKTPKPDRNWEQFVGTYLMPRIAAFVITTAVVLFLSFAMQRLGPPARVAIGYAIGAIPLFLGFWWERRYTNYARVLMSIGFAIAYIVTYAARYIEFARIFESDAPAWVLMALIVAAWAFVAERRKSRVMAGFVTALAHYTIFLTGPGRLSVVALIIVTAGSAFFLWRHRWYAVAAFGMAGTYVNHLLWMEENRGGGMPIDFWLCMAFVTTYFLLFALGEVLAPESARRRETPIWLRSGIMSMNTAGWLVLGALTMEAFPFTEERHDLFLFSAASLLIVLGLVYLRLRGQDPLYNAYLTKGIAVATLGLAVRYSESALTAALAIEAAVLVFSARRSGLPVTRLLSWIVAIIALFQAFITYSTSISPGFGSETFRALVVEGLIAYAAMSIAAILYEKTNWQARAPRSYRLSSELLWPLWQLEFISEPPIPGRETGRFRGSWPIAYGMAAIASLIFLMFFSVAFAREHLFPVASVFAALATIAAALLAARSWGVGALVLVGGAAILSVQIAENAIGFTPPLAIAACVGLALCAFAAERRLFGGFRGLSIHQHAVVAPVLYLVFSGSLALASLQLWSDDGAALALGLFSLAALPLAILLNPVSLTVAAAALACFGFSIWISWGAEESGGGHLSFWILAAATLLGNAYFARAATQSWLTAVRGVWIAVLWATFCAAYAWENAAAVWAPFLWTLAAHGLLYYGLPIRDRVPVALSAITAFGVTVHLLQVSLTADLPLTPLLWRYAGIVLYWVVVERLSAVAAKRLEVSQASSVPPVGVTLAGLLAVCTFAAIPDFGDTYLAVCWTLTALALFGLSILFRQPYYRYAGLAVFGLTLVFVAAKIFLSDMDTLYKVIAGMVLGTVMLGVSFGYVKAAESRRAAKGPAQESE